LGKPQASFSKRQREQAKRDRQLLKAEKRAQRATAPRDESDIEELEPLTEPMQDPDLDQVATPE